MFPKTRFPRGVKNIRLGSYDLNIISQEQFNSTFQFKKQLGKGNFGTVNLYKNYRGDDVVIKLIRNPELRNAIREFTNYVKVTRLWNIPGLVKLYDAALIESSQGQTFAVMQQYIPTGTITHHKGSPTRIIMWALELFQTLEILHSFRFYHHDIHSKNLFVDHKGHILLGDFGQSCFRNKCTYGIPPHKLSPYHDIYFAARLFLKMFNDALKNIPQRDLEVHNFYQFDAVKYTLGRAVALSGCHLKPQNKRCKSVSAQEIRIKLQSLYLELVNNIKDESFLSNTNSHMSRFRSRSRSRLHDSEIPFNF